MRPVILNYLFSDINILPGVGRKNREHLARLLQIKTGNIPRIIDLVGHFPYSIIDRTFSPDLLHAPDGKVITTVVNVEEHILPQPRSKRPYRVICSNETGYLTVVFFNPRPEIIGRQLPVGQKRVLSGRIEKFDGILQMSHPDYIAPVSDIGKIKRIEPVYPLTHGIWPRYLIKTIYSALSKIPDLPEWIDRELAKVEGWGSWKDSMIAVHNPQHLDDLSAKSKTRQRIAYDELLASQIALSISRRKVKKQTGQKINNDEHYISSLLTSLPFKLTKGQEEVLEEVYSDMRSGSRMMRLLQGDVGSGKTIIALLAMLAVIECGKQSVLMAPTDILSRQHFVWINRAIKAAGLADKVRVELLTGRDKGRKREEILASLRSGSINLIIGTHALFQENVVFEDLGLAVIDEQHRFGVKQRLLLSDKGQNAHILLMSATPIPRTLTLTLYGDMDISTLKEKPAGRQRIDTRIMPIVKIGEITEGIGRAVKSGNRVYWVCPLIGQNEDSNEVAAAEKRFEYLHKIFGKKVAMVHGRMKTEQRDDVVTGFKDGDYDILVATTVIEVGVDVPEATIMVIEQAEKFGLAQLHQLRGRVGRGSKQSSCILLYGDNIGETGKKRLKILRDTEDGFRIAEEDLALRGGGEMLGTKQSGLPEFKFAVFPGHSELLLAAHDDMKIIMNNDPKLQTERGQNIRTLLYLFEYDSQIKYLGAG